MFSWKRVLRLILAGAVLLIGVFLWLFLEFVASTFINPSFYTSSVLIGGISIALICCFISYKVAVPELYMVSSNDESKPTIDATHDPVIEKTGLRNAADYNQRDTEPDQLI